MERSDTEQTELSCSTFPPSRSLRCRSLAPFVSRTGPFGTRWERRWCERHGKEMGTRRKRPTFPRSHLVPSSYSRVSMWRELEEINRVTWDPRNERRERRRDECGAVGLFPFPSHSHPSLPRVTHSAAPHSLHSSVREMNGVRRTVTTRGESEKKPRGRDTTRLGKTRERCGEDTIRAVSLPTVPSLLSVLRHPFSYLGLTAHPSHVRSLRVSSPYVSATRRSSPGSFPRLSFTPVHFSSPGGLVPRAGKKGECWTFLDWRLNSENDSPVHGQPSFDSLLPFRSPCD